MDHRLDQPADPCFNSLFEMLDLETARKEVSRLVSFNSLFEMHVGLAVMCAASTISFNSLFEMPADAWRGG